MKLWFERGAWASKRGRRVAEQLQPKKVRRVAVVRHAALGDMVITRPFLRELRRFMPNAEITLSLTSNYTYGAPDDLVDRVHVVYGSDQRDVPLKEQVRRGRELGEQDILFDLAATTRSFYLCALSKAQLKLGFPYHPVQNPLFYDIGILRSDFRFEAEVMLDFLNILGHRPQYPLDFAYPCYTAAQARPRVVYFLGASVASKCYPEAQMLQVIKRLARETPNLEHVILEGVREDERAGHLLEKLVDCPNVRVQTSLPLDQLAVWLAESRLVVSNDTGVRNLAIATHTPTLGLFFSTVPYRYWPQYEKHYAVFNADGQIPAVEQVVTEALEALATQ